MLDPYSDDPSTYGHALWTQEDFDRFAALSGDETPHAATAVEIDVRKHIIEKQVAGVDDVGIAKVNDGVAICVRSSHVEYIGLLAVDVECDFVGERNDG